MIENKLKDGRILRIYNDETPQSPREDECLSKIISLDRSYCLTDDDIAEHHQIPGDLTALRKYIVEQWSPIYIEPLLLYEHSAVSLSTGNNQCKWDTRVAGYVFVPLADATGYPDMERIESVVHAELDLYTEYINGNVYGFKMFETETCKCCEHVKEIEVDACWGFYGTDWKSNGLYDNAGITEDDIIETTEH